MHRLLPITRSSRKLISALASPMRLIESGGSSQPRNETAVSPQMKMPPFEYACPTTLSEAVSLLASHKGEAKALAGGQSLVPMLAFRLAAPTLLVDLNKLTELRYIRIGDDGVRLGAMVRWRQIEDDVRLLKAHPLLVAAVKHVAHYQVRNRGTVGGSLAHA